MKGRKHDHDDNDVTRPIQTMLLTIAVIALLLIAFLLGVYVCYHHSSTVVNNTVRVTNTCPLNQAPIVIPPNGKG